jgi:hypothetical protein
LIRKKGGEKEKESHRVVDVRRRKEKEKEER